MKLTTTHKNTLAESRKTDRTCNIKKNTVYFEIESHSYLGVT